MDTYPLHIFHHPEHSLEYMYALAFTARICYTTALDSTTIDYDPAESSYGMHQLQNVQYVL